MQKREIIMTELKPESVDQYRRYHDAVWTELEEIYREAGYEEISCFLRGSKLIVYVAYDEERMVASRDWLDGHHVEQKWQAIMQRFKCEDAIEVAFDEVYRLPSRARKEVGESTSAIA